MALVRRLVAAGVKPEEIGVITPYNAQVGRRPLIRPAEGPAARSHHSVD